MAKDLSLSHSLTLRHLTGPVLEPFDCGDSEQNAFLLQRAWPQQEEGFSKTYLAYVGGMLAGYVTLVVGEIELSPEERPANASFATLPALKLAQMGVDTRFQGQGLGTMLVDLAIMRAQELAETGAGCRYVILDAKPNRVGFYQAIGFEENSIAQERRESRARRAGRTNIAKSMRLDIRDPRGAISKLPAVSPTKAAASIGFLAAISALVFWKRRDR